MGISAARRTMWSAWFWSRSRPALERVHHHATITAAAAKLRETAATSWWTPRRRARRSKPKPVDDPVWVIRACRGVSSHCACDYSGSPWCGEAGRSDGPVVSLPPARPALRAVSRKSSQYRRQQPKPAGDLTEDEVGQSECHDWRSLARILEQRIAPWLVADRHVPPHPYPVAGNGSALPGRQ